VQPVPRPGLIAAAAASALTVAVAIAVGGDSGRGRPAAPAAARPALVAGAALQRARCAQWRRATGAQRGAVVRALARTVGGPSGAARGTTLSAGEALGLFARACASPVARHFLLYELYTRAAAFRSLRAR